MSAMSEKLYKLIDRTVTKRTGIFCAVCNFLLKSIDDDRAVREYDCCHDCYLRYAESRKEAWKAGWRPSREIVDEIYKEKSRLFIK